MHVYTQKHFSFKTGHIRTHFFFDFLISELLYNSLLMNVKDFFQSFFTVFLSYLFTDSCGVVLNGKYASKQIELLVVFLSLKAMFKVCFLPWNLWQLQDASTHHCWITVWFGICLSCVSLHRQAQEWAPHPSQSQPKCHEFGNLAIYLFWFTVIPVNITLTR